MVFFLISLPQSIWVQNLYQDLTYSNNNIVCAGACHGDDMAYAIDNPFIDAGTTANDRLMIDRFVRMLTSFAATRYIDCYITSCLTYIINIFSMSGIV